ncbi:MAG: SMP-30/gluconolactonase/LRE family protein [Duncaniella sp.]|nr:SMP-30/gluconolactonase/LRE family protein [Duncaniella sp.]
MNKSILSLIGVLAAFSSCSMNESGMKESSLFVELPDICPTPDGMAVDRDGNLILACPNFADTSKPAVIMRITPEGGISKWIDVPVLDTTGLAAPMGIAFNDKGELYVCDNQGWSGSEAGRNQGRLLRLSFDGDGNLTETVTIASGMEHPNGVRVRDGQVYVTQSILTPLSSDRTVSGVYRFSENDRDVAVTNSEADPNLLFTVVTENPKVRYGLDGLDFDSNGNLYVGNFGDASIIKVSFDADGRVSEKTIWAQDTTQLTSVDGICIDRATGNMYVADFSANAIARVTPDGKVRRIAQSPDCDGSDGGLDQPGEPIVWGGRLIVSCFDAVTDSGKTNTAHDRPYTLAQININE